MLTYVIIGEDFYQTDTKEQIEAAKDALAEAGLTEAEVWASPRGSLRDVEEMGDPDAYLNGQRLFLP